MITMAKKEIAQIGMLIRPNGTRLPIIGLFSAVTPQRGRDFLMEVAGVYAVIETTIGAAIARQYSLENATPALLAVWRGVEARMKGQTNDAPN